MAHPFIFMRLVLCDMHEGKSLDWGSAKDLFKKKSLSTWRSDRRNAEGEEEGRLEVWGIHAAVLRNGRDPRTWAIIHHLPGYVCRKLHVKCGMSMTGTSVGMWLSHEAIKCRKPLPRTELDEMPLERYSFSDMLLASLHGCECLLVWNRK